MPLRNFSLCESAKLISPDKCCCWFPKGLGKIPAGMFSGFQISSPQQLDTQTLTTKNFLVSGYTSFTNGHCFWHISGSHVVETWDISQRMPNRELRQAEHKYESSLESNGSAAQVREKLSPSVSWSLGHCLSQEKVMGQFWEVGYSRIQEE